MDIRDALESVYRPNSLTFSVLDAKKASELYDMYCDMAKAQLIDATENLGVLAAAADGRRATAAITISELPVLPCPARA